jgi:glucose/arabinose dehydrogenase/mono/diheme cytochrome c family protein
MRLSGNTILLFALGFFGGTGLAQGAGKTVWDGVYSPAQAERGKAAYTRACAQCHGEDLAGYQAILKGDHFMTQWRETSLNAFFKTISNTMPRDVPGSLPSNQYLDITAYVLKFNGFPTGADELTLASIESVQVQGKDGPQEVPSGSLIDVVGCLEQTPKNMWMLTHGTRPLRTKNPAESTAAELKAWDARPQGTLTFELMSVYKGDPLKGARVEIKGLFVKNPAGDKINVTTIQGTGSMCGASQTQTAPAPGAATFAAKPDGQPIESRPPEKKDNQPAFPEQTRAPSRTTAPFQVTTLVDNLPAPWSVAFLPSGNLLLTERLPGKLHLLSQRGELSRPLTGVAELMSPGAQDIGLLDVIPDPNYATNHQIFFTLYDYVDKTNSNTYVAKAKLDEAELTLRDAKIIFRAQPLIPSKRLGGKTGGRIVIAPDGTLFVTTGDRSDSPPWAAAQDLSSHLGKVLHITADGAPAPDNPFLGKPGILPEIWAYGIRSPEGLGVDPKTGKLWENEHGPRGGDELNIIEKGKNYGWPVIAHGIDYPGTPIGEGITHKDGMEEPVYYWDPVIAPSGLAFYTGNLFPQWQGSVFVGGLRGNLLSRLKIVNDKVVEEEALLTDLHTRIRDVRVGPDGAVYVLTDSGGSSVSYGPPAKSKLLKLTPK